MTDRSAVRFLLVALLVGLAGSRAGAISDENLALKAADRRAEGIVAQATAESKEIDAARREQGAEAAAAKMSVSERLSEARVQLSELHNAVSVSYAESVVDRLKGLTLAQPASDLVASTVVNGLISDIKSSVSHAYARYAVAAVETLATRPEFSAVQGDAVAGLGEELRAEMGADYGRSVAKSVAAIAVVSRENKVKDDAVNVLSLDARSSLSSAYSRDLEDLVQEVNASRR